MNGLVITGSVADEPVTVQNRGSVPKSLEPKGAVPMLHTRRRFIATAGAAITGAALPRLSFGAEPTQRKKHLVTLSFDDGFKKSSIKTAEIYEKHKLSACINVVASAHMKDSRPPDYPNVPRGDFGLWNGSITPCWTRKRRSWCPFSCSEPPTPLPCPCRCTTASQPGRRCPMRHNHDDQPFFRKYEQATARLPVRDERQAGRADRPRRETAGREAGPQ